MNLESYFSKSKETNQYSNKREELEQIIIVAKQQALWMKAIEERNDNSYYQGLCYGYDILLTNDVKVLAEKLSEESFDRLLRENSNWLSNKILLLKLKIKDERSFKAGCETALNNLYRLMFTDKQSEVISELKDSVNNYHTWSLNCLKSDEDEDN